VLVYVLDFTGKFKFRHEFLSGCVMHAIMQLHNFLYNWCRIQAFSVVTDYFIFHEARSEKRDVPQEGLCPMGLVGWLFSYLVSQSVSQSVS
jgi:hypothetical protein